MKINNKVFFITGGSRGIGLAVAKMAASNGAHIHIAARTWDKNLNKILLDLGAQSVQYWNADLSTKLGTSELSKKLIDLNVDILFNNAGVLTGGLIEEQTTEEIDLMFQVNLNSLIHLTRAVIPGMIKRGQGKIINNASVSAFMHFPCASTYAASKSAVVAFTNCIELELQNTGVSTLCLITPGIKTNMFDEIEKKYSKNFEIPTDSISPSEYAKRIQSAIESDQKYLLPQGSTRFGLWMAQHMNGLFKMATIKRFNR